MTMSNTDRSVSRRAALAGLGAGALGLALFIALALTGVTSAQEATPAADETVLLVTLPAEALPVGDSIGGAMQRFTIPAGTTSTWTPTCCSGPVMEYVVSGTYTIRAQAAIQLVRHTGEIEQIPAGTEVVLEAGDGLISRIETTVETANSGTEPVILLAWLIVGGDEGFNGRVLDGWIEGPFDFNFPISLRPEPVVLRLRKSSMPDGSILPDVGLQFVVPIGDSAMLTRENDGAEKVYGEYGKAVPVYILTLEQSGDATPTGATPTS